MPNLTAIRKAVAIARDEAVKEARASSRCIQSRGTWLATGNAKDGQCRPFPEAECPEWGGTLREIIALVDRVLADYPQCEEVYLAGGYDGAETVAELIHQGEYEPWVSSWHVPVWTRAEGFHHGR